MTLPQRVAPADQAADVSRPFAFDTTDIRDRGPANAVIARLANAIAEQNVANATDQDRADRGIPTLGWIAALVVGSGSLWLAIILIGRALL